MAAMRWAVSQCQVLNIETDARLGLQHERAAKASDLNNLASIKKERILSEDYVGAQLTKLREVVVRKQLGLIVVLLRQVDLHIGDNINFANWSDGAVNPQMGHIAKYARDACCLIQSIETSQLQFENDSETSMLQVERQWLEAPADVRLDLEAESTAKSRELSAVVSIKKDLISSEEFVEAQLLKLREVMLQKQLDLNEELLQHTMEVEDELAQSNGAYGPLSITRCAQDACCKIENIGKAQSNYDGTPVVDAAKRRLERTRREMFESEVVEQFRCCITQDIMSKPVFASDGHTYEKWAIAKWLKNHKTSPKTGKELPDTVLRPNHALRAQIVAWHEWKNVERVPPKEEQASAPLKYEGFSVGQRVVYVKEKTGGRRILNVGDQGTVVTRCHASDGKVPVRWDSARKIMKVRPTNIAAYLVGTSEAYLVGISGGLETQSDNVGVTAQHFFMGDSESDMGE